VSTDNPKPDVDELQAQLEHTRGELADTVDALAAKLDVKSRVGDQVDDVKAKVGDRFEGVKEGVKEKVSQTKDKVVDAASHAKDAAAHAKDTVATQAHRVTDSVGSGSGAGGAEDVVDSTLASRPSGAPTSSSRPRPLAETPRPAVGAHRAPTSAPASSLSTEAMVALGGLAVAVVGVVRYVATRR
jgi:gas vesicle protein